MAICKRCGIEFEAKRGQRYCSDACRSEAREEREKYDPGKAVEKSATMAREYGFDYGAEQKRRILEEIANKPINKKEPVEVPEPDHIAEVGKKVDVVEREPTPTPDPLQTPNVDLDRLPVNAFETMLHALGPETAKAYVVGRAFMSLVNNDLLGCYNDIALGLSYGVI